MINDGNPDLAEPEDHRKSSAAIQGMSSCLLEMSRQASNQKDQSDLGMALHQR
jgi:hypothetical protein